MQKYLTENEVSPEEAERWKPVTHQFIPSGSKYYVSVTGPLIKSNFGDDDRE